MEKNMEKNLLNLQLRHQQPRDKGQVDKVFHFRQSGQKRLSHVLASGLKNKC
jgi:hypothetical protein